MLNKIFKLFATLSIVGVVAFGVGCSNYDNDIDNLQKQIDELKGNGDAISTALKNLEAVAATQAQLAAQADALRQEFADQADYLQGLYDGLNGNLATLKSELDALAGSAATKADVAALKSEIEGLLGDYYTKTEIDAKLSAIETKLGGTYTKDEIDAAITAAKEALDKKCADLAGEIEKTNARMKTAEDALEALQADSDWFFDEWKPMIEQQLDIHKEWSADVVAAIYDDLDTLLGHWDPEGGEDGEGAYVDGWKQYIDAWKKEIGDPESGFLAGLYDKITNGLTRIANLEAALDGFVTYDSETGEATHTSVKTYIDTLIDRELKGNTTLAQFYNNYTELQKLFVGQTENWTARAEWLKSTGNASYADYIEQLYKDINELATGVSALAESTNNLQKAILNTITAELDQNGSIAQAIENAISGCTSDIDELLSRVSELETTQKDQAEQIKDLINRIQSLVYVPEYSDGKIHIGGLAIQYTNAEGELTTLMLSSEDEDVVTTLTYRVSPASLAEELAKKADWKFYANTTKRTRAITPADVKIESTKYAGTDADAGLIEFTISTTHTFETEDLAIALCVSLPGSNNDAEGDNGDVEEGENTPETPETRADDEPLTVKTEFTSPYTIVVAEPQIVNDRFVFAKLVDVTEIEEGGENTGDCMCEGECFCDDACKNGTVEGDDEGEEGEGEEEEETPAEPVYEWRPYDVLAQWNSAHTTQYYKTTSQIYADLNNEYKFFQEWAVVYYDPKAEKYFTLEEMAGKWNIDLDWGFTHVDGQALDKPESLGTKGTDYKFENSAKNEDSALPYHSIERLKGFKDGLKAQNGSSYAATDRIHVYLFEKGNFGGEHFVVDENQYNNFYYVVRDILNVKASAEPLIWNYTNWSQFFGAAGQGGDYTVKVNFTDLNEDQVKAITDDATAEWTVIPCKKDAFISFAEDGKISAAVAAYTTDDKFNAVFTIKDFAYAHGTKNTLTLKANTKGETSQVNVIVSVPVVTPAEKELYPFAAAMQNVTSTETDYLRYTLYAGEAQAVDGFDTYEQYTKDDVEAGHFVDLAEANKFLRFAVRTNTAPKTTGHIKEVAPLTPVKGTSKAVMNIYNANFVKSDKDINVDNAEVEAALLATQSSFLGFKFPTLDFTEEGLEVDEQGNPYIDFVLANDTYVEIPYGPIFPIKADTIRVQLPNVDWIQGSRLSGNDGMKGSYRDGSYFQGIKWSNFVHFEGLHINTGSNDTHDYNYEKADLNTVLRAGVPDENGDLKPTTDYKVVFEVIEDPDFYDPEDAPKGGQFPEIDPVTNLVTWHNDYYNHVEKNAKDEALWNTVKVKATLQSADGTVTYKERIVTLLAEVPFNNPTADKKMYKVVKNETTRINIGDLLHMINLVANDGSAVEEDMIYHSESINGSGRFYNRFTQELCYGLELTFDTDNIKVVNTDVETAGGKYELGGEYTIEEPMKDASNVLSKNAVFVLEPIDLTLQHPFEIRIPYSIKGNFGYNYTAGEIVFYLYSDDADLNIPGVEDGEKMEDEE